MIIVITVKDPKGQGGQIGNRDIAKSRLPGRGDIRIQGISESGLRHSQGAFDAVGEIPVFRRQMDQDLAVLREYGVRNLPGRAGNKISRKLAADKRRICGQRMIRRTDTGNRGRTEFSKGKRRLFLLLFCAQSRQKLTVFHPAQQGRKWHQMHGRPQKGKFLRQLLQNGRQQVQLQMVVASQIKGNKMLASGINRIPSWVSSTFRLVRIKSFTPSSSSSVWI